MSFYNYEKWGNFSTFTFEEKIAEAKKILVHELEIEESAIRQIRNSTDIGIAVGGRPTFTAYVVEYEVMKEGNVIAYLEGHLSTVGDYIHVFTS